MRDKNATDARNIGLIYGLSYASSTMYWTFGIWGVHALSLLSLFAAYFGILGNLIALARARGDIVRCLCIATFAVGVEWLRGDAWRINFPWYTVPHSFAAAPPLIFATRYLGTYGFSYVMWLFGAFVCFRRHAMATALLLIPLIGMITRALPAPRLSALIIQSEGSVETVIPTVTAENVSLAVLPEYSYFIPPELALKSPNGPAHLARSLKCPVVFGAVDGVYGDIDFQNVAVVIDSTAQIIGKFPKQRPVPLMLDGKPGKVRPVFPVESGILGVAICYDFDAPAIAASLVRSGATVFVAPTFDASSWGKIQHLNHELLLRLRAVEFNRWIVRAASSGRSESIDPSGNPSIEGVEINASGFAVVPYGHIAGIPPSIFMVYFGPACFGFTIMIVLMRALKRF